MIKKYKNCENIIRIEDIRQINNPEKKKIYLTKFLMQLLDGVYGNINRRVSKIIEIYQYLIEYKDYYEEERYFRSVILSKLDELINSPELNEFQKLEFCNIKNILE